jgi:hypothetical protein
MRHIIKDGHIFFLIKYSNLGEFIIDVLNFLNLKTIIKQQIVLKMKGVGRGGEKNFSYERQNLGSLYYTK